MTNWQSVDQYIQAQPELQQRYLEQIRAIAREIIPGGDEVISYQIPAVKLGGKPVVYFSAYEQHVSLYPLPHPLPSELEPFVHGKGTLRFALDKPLPEPLIRIAITELLNRQR
jgi:uncharacterized protein YdhG (YjbR/CyaY superfamily)